MNTVQKRINLNVGQPNNYQLLHVMQGGNDSIEIIATLYNENKLYTIDANVIMLSGVTPSGTAIEDTTAITGHTEHTVSFLLTKNMLAVDGDLKLSIVLIDSKGKQDEEAQVLYTFPFVIKIINAPKGSIQESDFKAITDYVAKAEEHAQIATSKADEASTAASSAASSADTAASNASNAAISETNAKTSETNAKASEESASSSAATASTKALEANNSADSAASSASVAVSKASEISDYAEQSKSYAVGTNNTVRENDSVDNAKYYYEQAEQIAEGLNGALLPMGTIPFGQLSSQTKQAGYMYNISNDFTSDETFKDGGNITYPSGTNVYYTADGYWDCLAGTSVTGVKGDTESSYRKGNVNITKEDLGLGNVDNTADTNKNVKHAETATKATQDSDGKQINTTYARKTELPVVDSSLDINSTNALQNKTITSQLNAKANAVWNKKSILSKGQSVTVPETTNEILIQYANAGSSSAVSATYVYPFGNSFSVLRQTDSGYTSLASLSESGKVTADSNLNGYIVVFAR